MTPANTPRRRIQTYTPRGFSLVELLVSLGLFTVVMTVSVGTLLALVEANKKAQSLESVIHNLTFAVDSISRATKTGTTFYCAHSLPGPSGLPSTTRNCVSGGDYLVFTDDHGARLAYRSMGNRIDLTKDNGATWIALTAPEVVVDEMFFYVLGTNDSDRQQPSVTISIRGHAGPDVSTDSSFNIQTTLTQRLLDT